MTQISYGRSDLLLEVKTVLDANGRYFSDWFETAGFSTARVYVVASGITSSSDAGLWQGYITSSGGTPETLLTLSIPVNAGQTFQQTGSYFAYGDIPLYLRFAQVVYAGSSSFAGDPVYVSVRGIS